MGREWQRIASGGFTTAVPEGHYLDVRCSIPGLPHVDRGFGYARLSVDDAVTDTVVWSGDLAEQRSSLVGTVSGKGQPVTLSVEGDVSGDSLSYRIV